MALVSGGKSTLNPNAPLFIPAAFQQVEDFSSEWWQLITTSTWYHDYWLSQHQDEEGFYNNADDDFDLDNIVDLLPDTFDFEADDDFLSMEAQFEEFIRSSENESALLSPNGVHKNGRDAFPRNLNMVNHVEGRGPKLLAEPAKYAEKPTKNMGVKYSPRRIQQPR